MKPVIENTPKHVLLIEDNMMKDDATNIDIKISIGSLLFTVDLDAGFFIDDEDSTFPYHNHGEYEFHYIIEGHGNERVQNNMISISPNMCLLVPPHQYHEHFYDQTDRVLKCCFKFSFHSQNNYIIPTPPQECISIINLLNMKECLVWEDKNNISSIIKNIKAEFDIRSVGYYTKVQLYFTDILISIVRVLAMNEKTYVLYDFNRKKMKHQRNMLIEDFFANSYMKEVKASTLANVLGISERQLNRVLQSEFGLSFKEKLIDVRIKMAIKLLLDTSTKIENIAESIGYPEVSHFSYVFKKKLFVSPSKFRNEAKKSINAVIYENRT